MADEGPTPPSGQLERQQQPPDAKRGKTSRWPRMPPTIDLLLLLNTISKILMVAAMAFLWARTRPLGMFGRRVIAVIAVGDFSLTHLLQMLNDIDSFRFNPPPPPAAPKMMTMTKVVVQDNSTEAPSSEVETTETPQDAVEQGPYPIVSQGDDDGQGSHGVEPDAVDSAGEEKSVPELSFPAVETGAELQVNEERSEVSVLPSFDFETTKTSHDEDRDGSLRQESNESVDSGASKSSIQSWDYLKDVFDQWDDDDSASLFD